MEPIKVKIQKLRENAVIPKQNNTGDAGYDLYACIDSTVPIPPGKCVKIPTGLAIAVPDGYFGAVFPRSGIATKNGLRLANCVAVCDAPYRGEYMVPLYNDSETQQTIEPNDRIAQIVIIPFLSVEFDETDKLNETDRGTDGFGSSGR